MTRKQMTKIIGLHIDVINIISGGIYLVQAQHYINSHKISVKKTSVGRFGERKYNLRTYKRKDFKVHPLCQN